MTPLRQRMTEDMRTAGLASGTQALYLDAVRNLAAHYKHPSSRPPRSLAGTQIPPVCAMAAAAGARAIIDKATISFVRRAKRPIVLRDRV
jgi:hypothetical protein